MQAIRSLRSIQSSKSSMKRFKSSGPRQKVPFSFVATPNSVGLKAATSVSCGVPTSSSSLIPRRLCASTAAEALRAKQPVKHLDHTMIELVEKLYMEGHKPLMSAEKKYGAPYTDTAALENLPIYDNSLKPVGLGDHIAKGLVTFFKLWTRLFFRDKYTHHAVTLETVAAVPGMIAGMLRHLTSLRRMQRDYGWIGTLLEEAENERMHLLTWMQLIKPTFTERLVVLAAQAFYTPFYTILYIVSPKTAHRFVGYLEETACDEYTHFLKAIDSGRIPNVPAPDIAKVYWNLAPEARLRDVVLVVRADEVMHREMNHTLSNKIREGIH